jgi:hypothetical protein
MSKKFLSPIKLAQGATNPSTGSSGELFFNTVDLKVYAHNGTSWVPSGGGVTVSATAPSSPIAGDAWYDSVDGTLYVYYDDGTGVSRTNLATNPNMESASAPALPSFASGSSQFTTTTSEFYAGTKSAMATASGSATTYVMYVSGGAASVSYTAGQTYTLSFYVKRPVDAGGAVQLLDSSNNGIGLTVDINTTNFGWQRVSYTWAQGTGTSPAGIQVATSKNGTSVYLDAILIENTGSAGVYFDGSTSGASWSGTANASTSTLVSTTIGTAQWVEVAANSGISVALEGRVGVLESQVSSLPTQVATTQAEVDAVEIRATSLESRATALETANSTTNMSGLVPISPTSISVSSGSASASGNLVTYTNVGTLSLDGIFSSPYRAYRVIYSGFQSTTQTANFKFRNSSGDVSGALYYFQEVYATNTTVGASGTINQTTGRFGYYNAYTWSTMVIDIINPSNTAVTEFVNTQGRYGAVSVQNIGGYNDGSIFTGLSFIGAGGVITGNVQVYGYR